MVFHAMLRELGLIGLYMKYLRPGRLAEREIERAKIPEFRSIVLSLTG
jgi:hypothetical protein